MLPARVIGGEGRPLGRLPSINARYLASSVQANPESTSLSLDDEASDIRNIEDEIFNQCNHILMPLLRHGHRPPVLQPLGLRRILGFYVDATKKIQKDKKKSTFSCGRATRHGGRCMHIYINIYRYCV